MYQARTEGMQCSVLRCKYKRKHAKALLLAFARNVDGVRVGVVRVRVVCAALFTSSLFEMATAVQHMVSLSHPLLPQFQSNLGVGAASRPNGVVESSRPPLCAGVHVLSCWY